MAGTSCQIVYVVMGIKPRALYTLDKHSANWAMSQAPGVLLITKNADGVKSCYPDLCDSHRYWGGTGQRKNNEGNHRSSFLCTYYIRITLPSASIKNLEAWVLTVQPCLACSVVRPSCLWQARVRSERERKHSTENEQTRNRIHHWTPTLPAHSSSMLCFYLMRKWHLCKREHINSYITPWMFTGPRIKKNQVDCRGSWWVKCLW